MIQIRQNIFETNSSSTHSLCICREDEFDKWKNGEVYLIADIPWGVETKEVEAMKNKTFISKEDAIVILEQCADKGYNFKDLFYTYDNFIYGWDYYSNLETYEETYTDDKTGVTYVAFGKYGYDG